MKMTPKARRLVTFVSLTTVISAASMLACSSLPALSYQSGSEAGLDGGEVDRDDGSVRDATLPPSDSAPNPGVDAGLDAPFIGPSDAGNDVGQDDMDASDDTGGDDAGTLCGSVVVANCSKCPGAPLMCKKSTPSTCVADCNDCVVGALPCWRCPASGPKGICATVNSNGVINCSGANLCTCDAATDCPTSPGSQAVCGALEAGAATHCYTCGEKYTNGLSCAVADGGVGTCSEGTGEPVCQP